MKKQLAIAALAALSVCWLNPALAKPATASPAQPLALADEEGKVLPNADLTGQMVYTSTGNTVGRVAAMITTNGMRAAIISTEQRLGIGGVRILLTIDKLQARENGGGFFTNLNQAQVRALPKAP